MGVLCTLLGSALHTAGPIVTAAAAAHVCRRQVDYKFDKPMGACVIHGLPVALPISPQYQLFGQHLNCMWPAWVYLVQNMHWVPVLQPIEGLATAIDVGFRCSGLAANWGHSGRLCCGHLGAAGSCWNSKLAYRRNLV